MMDFFKLFHVQHNLLDNYCPTDVFFAGASNGKMTEL